MKSTIAFTSLGLLLLACSHAPAGVTSAAESAQLGDGSQLVVKDLRAQVIACTEAAIAASGLPVKASLHDFHSVGVDMDKHAFSLWTDTQRDDEIQIEQDITIDANTDLTMGKGGRYYTKTTGGYTQNGFHVRFCNDCFNGTSDWTWLTLGESLPHYFFDPAPSALGETTGDGRKVESFTVIMPPNASHTVPFVNVDTGLATDFALDVFAYADCLNAVTPAQ
jgi:hypothetical protein